MDESEYATVYPTISLKASKCDSITDIHHLISAPLASSTLIVDDFPVQSYRYSPVDVSYLKQGDNSSIGSSGSNTLDEMKSDVNAFSERDRKLTFTVDNEPQNNWRLKLTIPEPFNMSLRDANRRNIKAKLQQQMYQEIERKKREEEDVECCHQFRANPVPPHTYLPVYERMTVEEKLRKIHRRDKSCERMLQVQRPFDFSYREEVKKLFRSTSAPDLSCPTSPRIFKAQPAPKYVQKRSRSAGRENRKRTDINTSSLKGSVTIPLKQPRVFNSNNTICPRLKKMRDLENEATWIKNNLRPSLILNPPDFKSIHKKLAKKQVQKQIQIKQTTSCEPFHLLTSSLPSRKEKIKEDMKRDSETLPETRWPFTAPRKPVRPVSFSASNLQYSTSTTPKLNWAAKLRLDKSKQEALDAADGDQSLPHQEIWRNSVRRSLSARITSEYTSETIEEKLKRKKFEVQMQHLEYEQEMADMVRRVERRPLLMEQQVEMAARKRAERQFVEKLRKQGLTEEFILEKSLQAQRDSGFAPSSRSASRTNSNTPSSKPSGRSILRRASSSENLTVPSRPESHSSRNRLSAGSTASQSSEHSATSSEAGEM